MAGISRSNDPVETVGATPGTDKKKIKAIPFSNGTTVVIRAVDFENAGVEHADVTWDYRIDDFTVTVGDKITSEAANVLVTKFPESFVFV